MKSFSALKKLKKKSSSVYEEIDRQKKIYLMNIHQNIEMKCRHIFKNATLFRITFLNMNFTLLFIFVIKIRCITEMI